MIDSHCHLDHPCFADDLQSILLHAHQSGVQHFIVPGIHHKYWHRQLTLSKKHANISNAFGIHPWYCDQHHDTHLQLLESLLPRAVAVGECGLDFTANKPAHHIQLRYFQQQLELAQQYNLPVIIHSVQANNQVAEQLRLHPSLCGVIHGFSGSLQEAEIFIKQGFYIGLGTRLLQQQGKRSHALLSKLPLTSIVLETDAPDGLSKKQRNEPAYLLHIAQTIATIRQQDIHIINTICEQNTRELFSL